MVIKYQLSRKLFYLFIDLPHLLLEFKYLYPKFCVLIARFA
jgi:hypothetical protein